MIRFPMSIDLNGKTVCLIGKGPQIREKAGKLAPFGAVLTYCETFSEDDAAKQPAMVIVGDTDRTEAERICNLCRQYRIPVNVVDVPALCSFYFPALITRGELTISVSSGGGSPAAAGYLRRQIEEKLPDETEQILDWINQKRGLLREQSILKEAIAAAFAAGHPLTEEELRTLQKKSL